MAAAVPQWSCRVCCSTPRVRVSSKNPTVTSMANDQSIRISGAAASIDAAPVMISKAITVLMDTIPIVSPARRLPASRFLIRVKPIPETECFLFIMRYAMISIIPMKMFPAISSTLYNSSMAPGSLLFPPSSGSRLFPRNICVSPEATKYTAPYAISCSGHLTP